MPAVVVVWLGLKQPAWQKKFISTGMIVLLAVIIGVSFLSGKADISQAIYDQLDLCGACVQRGDLLLYRPVCSP